MGGLDSLAACDIDGDVRAMRGVAREEQAARVDHRGLAGHIVLDDLGAVVAIRPAGGDSPVGLDRAGWRPLGVYCELLAVRRFTDAAVDAVRDGAGHADRPIRERVYGGRCPGRLRAVLRGHQCVPVRDDRAGDGRQPADAVSGLGGRGLRVVLADRILLPQTVGGGGGEESVHRQPHRRPRAGAGDLFDLA